MGSLPAAYTAEFFKKDQNEKSSAAACNYFDSSTLEDAINDLSSDSECDDDSESEYDEDSESSSSDDYEFTNEDKLISRLYREVVDEIMQKDNLYESKVNKALSEMRQEISQGHKKGFRRFRGINFNESKNCCGYLRRYAICHTGLVKQAMWNFFQNKKDVCKLAKIEILQKNHLKIVSLGGGPGNDLVGFCCSLQEIVNSVKKLDLYVIDICKGWEDVFPTILRKACKGKFGCFTECIKNIIIRTGFKAVDLTTQEAFKNEDISACLAEADVVLMVKLTSFLPDTEAGNLIQNVVDSMKPEAKLIFIDHPYDKEFFSGIQSLNFIHYDYVEYKLSFNPNKYQSPSIKSTVAEVGIFEKIINRN